MQSLEEAKDVLPVPGIDADTVVTHCDYVIAVLPLSRHVNERGPSRVAVLYAVAYEVLEKLPQVDGVHGKRRQGSGGNFRAAF
jgi:hypothetical protein